MIGEKVSEKEREVMAKKFLWREKVSFAPSIVNFTNILLTAFAPISLHKKITNPNCKHIKAAKNTLAQKSCS